MPTTAALTLLLVGALTAVGCGTSGDGQPSSDRGVILPDSGPADLQTGISCSAIASCYGKCSVGDQACMNTCFARGSSDAQAKFQAVVSCMNDAGASGVCSTECTDPSSDACSDCVVQECAAEIDACKGVSPVDPNSGALCGQAGSSCHPSDICVIFSQGAANGMCLGTCNNLGDHCQVADLATQLSKCAFQVSLGGQGQYVCGWLCEVSGKAFACPNDTDYACAVFDKERPEIKYCIPK